MAAKRARRIRAYSCGEDQVHKSAWQRGTGKTVSNGKDQRGGESSTVRQIKMNVKTIKYFL